MGTKLRVGELHKKFGKRIKDLREKKEMTQEDLAAAIEVDRSYMGFLERGEKNATLDKIGKLANALDTNLENLFKNL